MPLITALRTELLTLPLNRPWAPDVTEMHVIVVEVDTDDGATGTGVSWTPTIGAHAVRALLDHDIRSFAVGREADARDLWPALWRRLHEAGSGGITTIAMAGVDLALWDAEARRAGTGIADHLGRRRSRASTYASGVNLHFSDDELAAQVARWVADGHHAVKVKVGRPDLSDDLRRVARVREIIGSERRLMVDANQRWDLPRAVTAARALAEFDIEWLEEPLLADDLAGHRALHGETGVAIALGENLHTEHRFSEFLQAGAVDIVQPNVVRVGGITPFLRIAALADDAGVRLVPHLLPDLSGQLVMALENETMVEDIDDASFEALGALRSPGPVRMHGGTLETTGRPGLGLRFRRS